MLNGEIEAAEKNKEAGGGDRNIQEIEAEEETRIEELSGRKQRQRYFHRITMSAR